MTPCLHVVESIQHQIVLFEEGDVKVGLFHVFMIGSDVRIRVECHGRLSSDCGFGIVDVIRAKLKQQSCHVHQ